MQRVEGALTPYEVYCFRCRVTFPVEARRCLHCGGRLFARGERVEAAGPVGREPELSPPLPSGGETDEGLETMVRRFGGLTIWALVALAAALANLCQRG